MPNTLQFRISLPGSKPSIWRSFQVTDDYRLDRFHQVIQIVMEWWNYHLHEFEINKQRYGMIIEDLFDDFDPGLDETKAYLKQFRFYPGDQFTYLYDFGDSWEHLLEVEEVKAGRLEIPVCIKGENAAPPEDCGGIWGYTGILEILKDPGHPEYEDYINWLPEDFNPSSFNIQAVNAELKKFGEWHNEHPRKKSTPWHQV